MKKILFLTILICFFPSIALAQVDKIVFTTDPQSLKPNTLSPAIIIQTQDDNGNVLQTPETLDIQFISTSATGAFLGSTGNPATIYMSKNTANKTFYYKDSTEGNFNITINVRGRDTGVELSVSQPIIISSDDSENNNTDTAGEVLSASTITSSGSGSSGGSTNNVSSLSATLEILAGNDRTTAPGSPIWFQATLKKNTTGVSPSLNWSFGDGGVGSGFLVEHTYKYAGDYVVVLSSRVGDIFSISRLKVKVVGVALSVKDGGEYLEISNDSNSEINLFNWKIENQGKGFIFQPNTIILPHSTIKLDKKFLIMKGLDNSLGIVLKNATGEQVFAISPIEKSDLTQISKNIDIIKNEALVIQNKIPNTNIKIDTKEVEATTVSAEGLDVPKENVIYEAPQSFGLLAKLTNFIKRVFSK